MKKLSIVCFVLILFAEALQAVYADCFKDGQRYPEGAVADGYKCGKNGTWERK